MLPGESARSPDADGTLPRPIAVRPDAIDAVSTEWLLTNGIGGFAMGTVLGVPTRRYHGLLVAAMRPPIDRVVALHSMDELVVIDRGSAGERRTNLTRFHFEDAKDRTRAHPTLVGFERGAQCVWRYLVDGVSIEKRLHLFHGRNAVEIRYCVRAPGRRCAAPRPAGGAAGLPLSAEEGDGRGDAGASCRCGGAPSSAGASAWASWS
ncbi:MAG: glycogen debranching enzyme N-terminal domain-containing protein [Phycisphaerales bacterium]